MTKELDDALQYFEENYTEHPNVYGYFNSVMDAARAYAALPEKLEGMKKPEFEKIGGGRIIKFNMMEYNYAIRDMLAHINGGKS